MRHLLTRVTLWIAIPVLAIPVALQAKEDRLSKVEIGSRGKAATALVEIKGRTATGTAFCVDPDGLFITNEHVVRGVGAGDVTLVLNPSSGDQKVLKAKVVRMDRKADLALLRASGAKDLPSLPIGSHEKIAELLEVVACGFPLGKGLSLEKKEYPAVSVNAGHVASLRQKDGQLQSLQVDVLLTFGNSGGPILDDTGKVIGVVVSGIPGTGINQAIPVNLLHQFLLGPELVFTPPELTRENLDTPMEFKARAVSFRPQVFEPTLKLVLQDGDREAREFPMTLRDGEWVATAAPAPGRRNTVELTARLGMASVTGTTDDFVFKVDDRPVRFKGVRRMTLGPKPSVLLADGKTTLEGQIIGLGSVDVELAGQKVKLDLSKASELTVEPLSEFIPVTATVVASIDEKEVARLDVKLHLRGTTPSAIVDPDSVVITAPTLNDNKVVRKLPDLFTDVVVGGGGRYLIFHLAKLKKLAIFDVNEARVTKYIPVAEDDIAFTAGLNSVIIGLKRTNKLERWSLSTFELEKSAPPPFNEPLVSVLMGHASNGPLVANGYFIDLATYRTLPIRGEAGEERPFDPAPGRVVSADGSVFGGWKTNQSPNESSAFICESGSVKRFRAGDLMHVLPGPDGRWVYTSKGVVTRTLKRNEADDASYGYCLPAMRGDYFLSVTSATSERNSKTSPRGGEMTAYLQGVKQPIAKLEGAEHSVKFDGWDRDPLGAWKRFYFVPDAKMVVVLPEGNDELVLYRFDVDAALEQSGLDYLVVTSQPPADVKAGEEFRYPIRVKSKEKKVEFHLDDGPKGMSVSTDGVVTWPASPSSPEAKTDVIITVRSASGKEVFHTFTLNVVK